MVFSTFEPVQPAESVVTGRSRHLIRLFVRRSGTGGGGTTLKSPPQVDRQWEYRRSRTSSLVASMHHAVRQTAAPVSMCWRSKMMSLLQEEDQLLGDMGLVSQRTCPALFPYATQTTSSCLMRMCNGLQERTLASPWRRHRVAHSFPSPDYLHFPTTAVPASGATVLAATVTLHTALH